MDSDDDDRDHAGWTASAKKKTAPHQRPAGVSRSLRPASAASIRQAAAVESISTLDVSTPARREVVRGESGSVQRPASAGPGSLQSSKSQVSAKKRAILEAGAFLGDGPAALNEDGSTVQRQLFHSTNMKLSSLKDARTAPGVMGASGMTLHKVSLTPKKLSELSPNQAAHEARAAAHRSERKSAAELAALHRAPSFSSDSGGENDDLPGASRKLAFTAARKNSHEGLVTPATKLAGVLGVGLSPLEESPLQLDTDRSEDLSARRHLVREVSAAASLGRDSSFLHSGTFQEQRRLARERGKQRAHTSLVGASDGDSEQDSRKASPEERDSRRASVEGTTSPERDGGAKGGEAAVEEVKVSSGVSPLAEMRRVADERAREKADVLAKEREETRRRHAEEAASRKREEEDARRRLEDAGRMAAYEDKRRREEEERRRKIEGEDRDMDRKRKAVDDERREAVRMTKIAEGDRCLAEAAGALLLGTLSNAAVMLGSAEACFLAGEMDEDECELRLRGTRQALKQAGINKEKTLAETQERTRLEEEMRLEMLQKMARDAEEKRVAAAVTKVRDEWFQAAEQGETKKIEEMLEQEVVTDSDLRDETGNSALHIACRRGHKKVAKALLRAGVNVHAKNEDGLTPLHFTEAFSEEISPYLLEQGANVLAKSAKGETPKDFARKMRGDSSPEPEVSEDDESSDDEPPMKVGQVATPSKSEKEAEPVGIMDAIKAQLFKAAEAGDATKVKDMIKEGVNADATDKFGNSVLIIGASIGLPGVVRAIVNAGCNLNQATRNGETPLVLARRAHATSIIKGNPQGYLEVVEILEEAGATEDASILRTIHSKSADAPASRPGTALERPGSGRPGSGVPKARPTTATRKASDMAKLAAGLFGVFQKPKLAREVSKLEGDVKALDKAAEKLGKAERHAVHASEKATKAHSELMARADAFAPRIERVKAHLGAVSSLDDARAVVLEAKNTEKDAALSQEAFEAMGWPYEDLAALTEVVATHDRLRCSATAHRHILPEEDRGGDDSRVRRAIHECIAALEPLNKKEDGEEHGEGDELKAQAQRFGLPFDEHQEKVERGALRLAEGLLKRALHKEGRLQDASRGKKAVKKDVQVAYDALDKALDLADELMVKACLDVRTESHTEALRRLDLLEKQHEAVLFG